MMTDADSYLARPAAGPAPAILLLPPIFGIEPVICAIADRWAARGFLVLAVNQFRHEADPETMERTEAGRARALARAKGVDVDRLVGDVAAALAGLRTMSECNGKAGAIGFCFGGRYAFLAAARLDVDAAAGFHPTQIGLSLADAPHVHAPLSLHFGAEDPLTPPSEIDALRGSLPGRDDAEIYVYPGATHNFGIPGVPGYDPAVEELAERRAFSVFDRLKNPR